MLAVYFTDSLLVKSHALVVPTLLHRSGAWRPLLILTSY